MVSTSYRPDLQLSGTQPIRMVSLSDLEELCWHKISPYTPTVVELSPFVGKWEAPLHLPHDSSPWVSFSVPLDPKLCCGVQIGDPQKTCPERTFLGYFARQGLYYVLFALSHCDMQCFLKASDGKVLLSAYSGTSRRANACRPGLVIACGESLNLAYEQVFSVALQVTESMGQLHKNKTPLPSWLQSIGWESGLALGANVSHDMVVRSIQALHEQGIRIGYVVIDEGWQELDSRSQSLLSFLACKERFPEGLAGLVEDLRAYQVERVGVTHGLMGAPGGVHEQKAKRYQLPPDRLGRYFLGYDLGRTFEFYYNFYLSLRKQGISFVRVSDQSSPLRFCREGMDITKLYQNLQEAIQAASSLQFNQPHMNSGCLQPENFFYWPTSQLARGCDAHTDKESFSYGKVLRDSLQVSSWLKNLMVPDFGVWTTKAPWSHLLATFHALSGGVYALGDLPGAIDSCLLQKILTPAGKRIIPKSNLMLSAKSRFIDPLQANEAFSAYLKEPFQGVVWVANLHDGQRGISGIISPGDVEGIEGDRFCVYSLRAQFWGTCSKEEQIRCRLKPLQSDIWTFSPISRGIAVIGFTQLFLLGAGVEKVSLDENYLHLSLSMYGPLLVYSERKILEVRRQGEVVPWDYDEERFLLLIDESAALTEQSTELSVYFE